MFAAVLWNVTGLKAWLKWFLELLIKVHIWVIDPVFSLAAQRLFHSSVRMEWGAALPGKKPNVWSQTSNCTSSSDLQFLETFYIKLNSYNNDCCVTTLDECKWEHHSLLPVENDEHCWGIRSDISRYFQAGVLTEGHAHSLWPLPQELAVSFKSTRTCVEVEYSI